VGEHQNGPCPSADAENVPVTRDFFRNNTAEISAMTGASRFAGTGDGPLDSLLICGATRGGGARSGRKSAGDPASWRTLRCSLDPEPLGTHFVGGKFRGGAGFYPSPSPLFVFFRTNGRFP
jgi:hypothetical protein